MIYSLNGKLILSEPNSAVVECCGVGYRCTVSLKTAGALPKLGEQVFLYTYMAVREDAVDLFGFATIEEMQAFKMITSVNGVGAKVGIAILSEFAPEYLYTYIAAGDYKALTAAGGVGPKLAQRIVLELKDKIGAAPKEINLVGVSGSSASTLPLNNVRSAVSALTALGFLQVEANRAIAGLDQTLPTEELVRQALARLSSGKF